jgi:NTP pyrophosphatase (non-canonical NTP hydrolase)
MDTEITVQDLKDRIQDFCEDRDWDQFHSAKDLAIGLVTEASELLEHFRFRSEAEIEAMLRETPKRREIAHELADAFFFILRFSQKMGFDLSSSLEAKMAVNAERYPIDMARGKNAKYTELSQ